MPLADWIRSKLHEYNIHSFYYFSHKDNLENILEYGILSQNEVNNLGIEFTTFAEESVQVRRDERFIQITDGNRYNLHDLVPLYLTPQTPTLYARRNIQSDIFFCVIQSFLISDANINYVFSDGNAGSQATKFYYSLNFLNEIAWDVIHAERWVDFPDGRRKRNAEFLVHPKVPLDRIWRFVVNNIQLKNKLENQLNRYSIEKEVSVDQRFFF